MEGRDFLLLGMAGGLLGADRTAFLQSLASRPIVAAPLAGIIAHDLAAGLWCGILLELLWLMRLPVGGFIPPDDTLSAICAVLFASALRESGAAGLADACALGALFSLPLGYFGRNADLAVRRRNGKAYALAIRESGEGRVVRVGKSHLSGAALFFASGFCLALFLGFSSRHLGLFMGSLSPRAAPGVFGPIIFSAVLLCAAGAFLSGLNARRGLGLFAASSAIAALAAFMTGAH